jgi:antitoxin YefM
MEAISYSTLRGNLASEMDRVVEDHSPIIVTRRSRASVVMMSLDDYEALEETSYLLRGPKNARRLLESITELESGSGTERKLSE